MDQLLGALAPAARRALQQTRERVLVDQRRWYQSPQPSGVLATLREAAWNDRRVDIAYQDRQGNVSQRTLDPLGLVAKAGVWYLIARSGIEYRTFRADRIAGAAIRTDGFVRPVDFDLDAYWRESTQRIESGSQTYWLTLRVAPKLLPDILRFMEHEVVDRAAGIVKINFANASAEVVAPQEFIDDSSRVRAPSSNATPK